MPRTDLLALAPDDSALHHHLGDILLDDGRIEEAIQLVPTVDREAVGFMLVAAVNQSIIRIPTPRKVRVRPRHPEIERIDGHRPGVEVSLGARASEVAQLLRLIVVLDSGGDDVEPTYLPAGRGYVFTSNRQTKSSVNQALGRSYMARDEYERETVFNLHTMDADGGNVTQISFNQSHDRNPTVRQNGDIMFSRWDHVGGRNHFKVFRAKPDGTDMFILFGAHSRGNRNSWPSDGDADRRTVPEPWQVSHVLGDVPGLAPEPLSSDPATDLPEAKGPTRAQIWVHRLLVLLFVFVCAAAGVLGNGKQRKSYLYIQDCIDAIFTAGDGASAASCDQAHVSCRPISYVPR